MPFSASNRTRILGALAATVAATASAVVLGGLAIHLSGDALGPWSLGMLAPVLGGVALLAGGASALVAARAIMRPLAALEAQMSALATRAGRQAEIEQLVACSAPA